MAEALILVLSGAVLGVAWSTLGVYLGSLVIKKEPPAAYAVRAVFLFVAVMFHGYLRSKTPRLFIFVLLMIICATVSLVSTAKAVTPAGATQILYPVLIGVGVLIVVNICVFPEFSSTFLGQITIETLNDTTKALEEAGDYFVAPKSSITATNAVTQVASQSPHSLDNEKQSNSALLHARQGLLSKARLKLRLYHRKGETEEAEKAMEAEISSKDNLAASMKDLTATKSEIRKKMEDCKTAQQECNFELAVAVLPPRDMKPISSRSMKRLVANTIAVIGACESRFALIGEEEPEMAARDDVQKDASQSAKDKYLDCVSGDPPAKRTLLDFLDHGKQKQELDEADDQEKQVRRIFGHFQRRYCIILRSLTWPGAVRTFPG